MAPESVTDNPAADPSAPLSAACSVASGEVIDDSVRSTTAVGSSAVTFAESGIVISGEEKSCAGC